MPFTRLFIAVSDCWVCTLGISWTDDLPPQCSLELHDRYLHQRFSKPLPSSNEDIPASILMARGIIKMIADIDKYTIEIGPTPIWTNSPKSIFMIDGSPESIYTIEFEKVK